MDQNNALDRAVSQMLDLITDEINLTGLVEYPHDDPQTESQEADNARVYNEAMYRVATAAAAKLRSYAFPNRRGVRIDDLLKTIDFSKIKHVELSGIGGGIYYSLDALQIILDTFGTNFEIENTVCSEHLTAFGPQRGMSIMCSTPGTEGKLFVDIEF